MNKKTNLKNIQKYLKSSNSVYAKFFLSPVALIFCFFFINYTNFKPFVISVIGLLFGITSAVLFFYGEILFAIVFFNLAVIFDFVDGLVARVKKTQSSLGILCDTYFDLIVLLTNSLGLILLNSNNELFKNLMMIYLVVHFAESWIDKGIKDVCKQLKNKKDINLNWINYRLYKLKIKFDKINLKVLLFYYQERYFCIFVLSPILSFSTNVLYFVIIMTIVMINFKVLLEISVAKVVNKKNNSKIKL